MDYKKIGDILELHRGYDLPVEQMIEGNILVVGSNGIVGYHNQTKSISPTVTIGRSGSIGKVHYYDNYTWVHNTALYVNDFKGNDPLYIYYILKNLDFENLKSSSVVPSLNRNYIYPMKVPFYENIIDQKNISKLLNSLDQKIALNTRMNAELEAMAKQLYDYWFVQFDFPDENGNPYKSSGGKMVWNEKLKREIPEGWEVKSINQLANGYRGVSYTKDDLVSEFEDSVLVLRGNNIPSSGQFVYDGNVAYIPKSFVSEEQKINKGDIIITMSSGSKEHVGKCFMFQNNSKHTFGAFLSKFTPQEGCRFIVYQFMLSDFFKAFVKSTCNGTGINNLTNDTFNNALFPFPPPRVLRDYESIAGGIYKNLGLNQRELVHFTHLRDSLLPMLMNGQVTIE